MDPINLRNLQIRVAQFKQGRCEFCHLVNHPRHTFSQYKYTKTDILKAWKNSWTIEFFPKYRNNFILVCEECQKGWTPKPLGRTQHMVLEPLKCLASTAGLCGDVTLRREIYSKYYEMVRAWGHPKTNGNTARLSGFVGELIAQYAPVVDKLYEKFVAGGSQFASENENVEPNAEMESTSDIDSAPGEA